VIELGADDWYGTLPPEGTKAEPVYTFNLDSPESYQSCPVIGLAGADEFEKFSNKARKFSAMTSPYPA
jgi:hypothetical protein